MADCSIATVANMEHGYIPKAGAVLGRVIEVLTKTNGTGTASP